MFLYYLCSFISIFLIFSIKKESIEVYFLQNTKKQRTTAMELPVKTINYLTASPEHIRAKNTSVHNVRKRNYKCFKMESDKGRSF